MTIFFDNWQDLLRVAAAVPATYLGVVLFVRLSGKRTTSQMNNFDWIVTVAMGSMVASSVVVKDVAVADALVGIGGLLAMQYLVTRSLLHSSASRTLFRAAPRLLLHRRRLLKENMRAERVLEQEVMAAVREAGLRSFDEVEAVILETDAQLSVIPAEEGKEEISLMEGVRGAPSKAAATPDA